MYIDLESATCVRQTRLGGMVIGLVLQMWLLVVILAPTPAYAQAAQELVACVANPNPVVREPCIRTALQAQDPNIRAAGLAAVFRTRNVIVMEFEPPPAAAAFMQRVDAGQERRGNATQPIDHAINFTERTGQQIAFRVDSFDNQTNTFAVTVRDTRFVEGRPDTQSQNVNRGQGVVSGESLQIGFRINPDNYFSQCSSSLSLVAPNELRGSLSCTGDRMFQRTNARIRFF